MYPITSIKKEKEKKKRVCFGTKWDSDWVIEIKNDCNEYNSEIVQQSANLLHFNFKNDGNKKQIIYIWIQNKM